MGVLTGSTLPMAGLLLCAANGIFGEAVPAIGEYARTRQRPEFLWSKLMGKPRG